MTNIEIWQTRADGGDSRYAIALGLMAIADAIKSTAAHRTINMAESSLDDKFDTLIRVMKGIDDEAAVPPDEEEVAPKRSLFWWRNR